MKDHQQALDKWYKEKGWNYWKPLSMFARLVEEVGEFGRLLNHDFGEKPKKETEEKQNYEDEIGDILYTLICFANAHHIDLDSAAKMSMEKVFNRDKDRFNK
jgi:NTP pyrophosphatase (non-canonical NTP hydrolase)